MGVSLVRIGTGSVAAERFTRTVFPASSESFCAKSAASDEVVDSTESSRASASSSAGAALWSISISSILWTTSRSASSCTPVSACGMTSPFTARRPSLLPRRTDESLDTVITARNAPFWSFTDWPSWTSSQTRRAK